MNASRTPVKRFLREPLVHFLALGALLFAFGTLREDSLGPGANRITVTSGVIDRLVEGFRLTWRRAPTEDELGDLVEDYVEEEVMYREALAMGLDRDDPVVRGRMRQKLALLNADLVETSEPTEEELRAYLDENPEKYRTQGRFSFNHVYVRSVGDLERATVRARSLLEKLEADPSADPKEMGDPFLYPKTYENVFEGELSRTFGIEFTTRIAALPVGKWSGPVQSTYGLHVVRLNSLQPGRSSDLDEIRDAVRRDVRLERQRQAEQAYVESLLSRYTVSVEWPETVP